MKAADVKNLSREEKIALYEAIQERKRRDIKKREKYRPNSGQLPIHKSNALDRFVFSGNGGGKTTLAVQEVLWAATGWNPVRKEYTKVPANIIVVLDAPSKVEDVWLRELRKWYDLEETTIEKRGKPYPTRITFRNGSTINFMFQLQEDLAFESIEAQSLVVYDEPPPRRIFIALKRGSRTAGHRTRHLMVGTPLSAPWLRTDIYEPWLEGQLEDVECFRFGTSVNEDNLSEGYLQEFSKHMTEEEKQIRLEGRFADMSGLALAHLFDKNRHIVEPFSWNARWPCVLAIDPAQAKPTVACLVGINPRGYLFYLKETAQKMAPREFARHLRDEFIYKYNVVEVICDSLGSTEGTGGDGMRSFIEVMNDEGVRARATSYNEKDDEAWLASIKDVLLLPDDPNQPPRLRIFDGNDMITREIQNVQWQKDRRNDIYKPKLEISKLDALACLKYALAANLRFKSPVEEIYRPSCVNFRDRLRV